YALEVEVGVDAEAHGDAPGALAAFVRAAVIDPSGIEALDGIRRVALAGGNPRGAAQAGMRLGTVLRTPRRAAVELRRAAVLWRQLGMPIEAKVAYFHALAREPESEEVFTALRGLLRDDGDDKDLEHLLTLRLAVVSTPEARLPLLIERGLLRHDRLGKQDAAIDDFKRILKIDPAERRALRELATLAAERQCHPQAIAYLERLLAIEDAASARAALLLELAEAHESAGDPSRALDILHDVIARTPSDLSARQRLVDARSRTHPSVWRFGALERQAGNHRATVRRDEQTAPAHHGPRLGRARIDEVLVEARVLRERSMVLGIRRRHQEHVIGDRSASQIRIRGRERRHAPASRSDRNHRDENDELPHVERTRARSRRLRYC
ncbi:MAG TPA: tetratricopeptide repeat protein, partial [Usitatibacter sp.]